MFCQILDQIPHIKGISVFGCVDLCCKSFIILLLLWALRMSVRQRDRQQVGEGLCCRDGNRSPIRANQCQNADRLMRLVRDLMKCRPFCHATVVCVIWPYHLNAILHDRTLLGQFVRTDCLFILHSWHEAVLKSWCVQLVFLDLIKCVSGGRGPWQWEPSRLWHESFSH